MGVQFHSTVTDGLPVSQHHLLKELPSSVDMILVSPRTCRVQYSHNAGQDMSNSSHQPPGAGDTPGPGVCSGVKCREPSWAACGPNQRCSSEQEDPGSGTARGDHPDTRAVLFSSASPTRTRDGVPYCSHTASQGWGWLANMSINLLTSRLHPETVSLPLMLSLKERIRAMF